MLKGTHPHLHADKEGSPSDAKPMKPDADQNAPRTPKGAKK